MATHTPKPGFATSELAMAGVSAFFIYLLATMPTTGTTLAIVRGCGILALTGLSVAYTLSRTRVKSGGP